MKRRCTLIFEAEHEVLSWVAAIVDAAVIVLTKKAGARPAFSFDVSLS